MDSAANVSRITVCSTKFCPSFLCNYLFYTFKYIHLLKKIWLFFFLIWIRTRRVCSVPKVPLFSGQKINRFAIIFLCFGLAITSKPSSDFKETSGSENGALGLTEFWLDLVDPAVLMGKVSPKQNTYIRIVYTSVVNREHHGPRYIDYRPL